MVRSVGVAVAISPYGVGIGPEATVFFPAPAFAIFVGTTIATVLGKGGNLIEFALGSMLAIALTSIATLSVSTVWTAVRGTARPRLCRALLVVFTVAVVITYFVTFDIYRARSSEGSVPVGDHGWKFHAFAIAISGSRERLPLRRFVGEHDYEFQLRSTWIGDGLVPAAPILISVELTSGATETPLTVAREFEPRRTVKRDGRVIVNRTSLLSDKIYGTSGRPQVTIPWWHRSVRLRLSFNGERTETVIIPLKKRGHLIPRYTPLFAFGMRH